MITGREELKRVVRDAVRSTPAVDAYTHLDLRALFSEARQGIFALLTTPALMEEARRYGDARLDADDRKEQAEAVFAALFIDRSPISRQAQATLWSLKKMGLDIGSRDLSRMHAGWMGRQADERLLDVLDMANLSSVAIAADLFEENAQPLSRFDERLSTVLCLDALADSSTAWPALAARGVRSHEAAAAFIVETAKRLEAESFLVERPFGGAMWDQCVAAAADELKVRVVIGSQMPSGLPDADALKARFANEGFSFRPYASGAAMMEQLPGLWEMARRAIAAALVDAYAPLLKSGWRLAPAEVINDVEQILSGGGNRGIHRP